MMMVMILVILTTTTTILEFLHQRNCSKICIPVLHAHLQASCVHMTTKQLLRMPNISVPGCKCKLNKNWDLNQAFFTLCKHLSW